MDTPRLIWTLIALGIFIGAALFYPKAQQNTTYSVVFGLLIFAAFGILFVAWFRK